MGLAALGTAAQAGYKLCRVKRVTRGPKGVPYAVTHDGRTLRYPDPDIKAQRGTRRASRIWQAG